ncbi:MAG: UDP-N-acetylglucosamine pyrophosphorylase [Clostridiales bacterium]|jgi:bifunctional UDP-N-acetylglucosamine pyrophosphorylase/glucosamine-1-phosphate N-acetyltransferase|nr:UDP-N-acetylglucosamine pyrophosphorylase [Clostridiales bacterium]
MKYSAIILKADRQNFVVHMESLSFYVEAAAAKAGILPYELSNNTEYLAVLRDDTPLIKPSSLRKIIKAHAELCEKSSCSVYCGLNDVFFIVSAKVYENVLKTAGGITDFYTFAGAVKEIMKHDKNCEICGVKFSKKEYLVVGDAEKLSFAAKILRKRINKKHMKTGVFLDDPNFTYIGPRVKIGKGSVIKPGSFVMGETAIGENCVIGPNTSLFGMTVGSSVNIVNSTAQNSKIADETQVGPYAYIRPGCDIGSHVKIGDFVEVKNSVIGDGSKASHLTYIGDAELGQNINMGCGTITANYDGKNKSKTIIEDGAFIGSNSNLIAPVTIKKGAFVAAGSTITDTVPENTLAIARSRQVIKTEWQRK